MNVHDHYKKGFKSVVDFRSPRTWKAAVGFYLFHLLVGTLLSIVGGLVYGQVSGVQSQAEAFEAGRHAGAVVAYIYCVAIYGIIFYSKQGWKNPWYFAGFALTRIFSFFGGLVGLISSAVAVGHKREQSMRSL